MNDSPRWCGVCNGYGDHHSDRHPLPTDDHVRATLIDIYGSGGMTDALAEHVIEKMPTWLDDVDDPRGLQYQLHMAIWHFFAGGGTAEIAANRILDLKS